MSSGVLRAIVLGGGVAGIAAALGLRDLGLQVTLLESHGWLGGRTFSFVDRHSARRLDNGPHVMLGCYRAMRTLLRRLGTEPYFAAAQSLTVAYRTNQGQRARLALGRLPVPLSMPFALWKMPWPLRQRLAALRGLGALLRPANSEWTLAHWLQQHGQIGAPAEWLWQPLCRAIMNVEPHEASALVFQATMREAFFGSAATGAFWIPQRPWGEIVGEAAVRVLADAGIDVQLHARVSGLTVAGQRITALDLGSGRRLDIGADTEVVSALPWHALAPLLGGSPPFAQLASAPLVSAYFAIDDAQAPPDEGLLTALVAGEPFHFLYRTPGARRGEFALLAGGCRQLDGCKVAEIEAQARTQMARHYPEIELRSASVRISKEARATIVAAPGAAAMRPAPGRLAFGPRNLRVCGDWTAVGLPSTLEGAARSAEQLLASFR
ncbi:hypothetical protein LBMAG49_28380 [Planctomycetota bacterium]|nr:hypothetical protein LBMAG49_28380 [Planctomycetota bacterium]